MINFSMWLGVFFGLAILDFVWVGYVKSLQQHAPISSALWAAIMIVITGFVTIGYVNDYILLLPAAFGSFIGTWIGVKLSKKWRYFYD